MALWGCNGTLLRYNRHADIILAVVLCCLKSTHESSSLFPAAGGMWTGYLGRMGSGARLPGWAQGSVTFLQPLYLLALRFLLRITRLKTTSTLLSYLGGSVYMLIHVKHLEQCLASGQHVANLAIIILYSSVYV